MQQPQPSQPPESSRPSKPDLHPGAVEAFLHDARTPLNAILAFSEMLAADPHISAGPERLQRWSALINSAARHLLAMVGVLPETGAASGADLADVADEVLLWMQPQAVRAGVTIVRGPMAGRVRADTASVQRVLSNLLSNAIRYNRPDGAVGIQARAGAHGSGQVLIEVTDSGHGLPPEQIQSLDLPLHGLGSHGGHRGGLGLRVAHGLVVQLGGTIQVTSGPGLGSCFQVRLPAADAANPMPASRAADSADADGTAGEREAADAAGATGTARPPAA